MKVTNCGWMIRNQKSLNKERFHCINAWLLPELPHTVWLLKLVQLATPGTNIENYMQNILFSPLTIYRRSADCFI
jgi:hypothetical protein